MLFQKQKKKTNFMKQLAIENIINFKFNNMKKQQTPYEEKYNDYIKNKQPKNKQIKKINPAKITINVSQCQYAVVRTVAKKLKWNIITQPVSNLNFDICWTDGHARQQIFARMQPFQKINHFPGMEILSRKNNLGKNLMQFKKKFEEEYDFFPLTWNLPSDYSQLKEYHDNRQEGKAQTFIVKPEASSQGRGIFLTRNIEKLKYERCVVQRYMHKPFLIDQLKFDFRIYVLLAGIDPLRIFVYEEGLTRFATQKYETPKSDNLDNKFMHLTNYAINKNSPDFIFNEDAKQTNVGHKRTLSSTFKQLEEQGHNVQDIKQKINDIIIKTIITGYPSLSRAQQGAHPQNFANDMCFEILGFDIILSNKLEPFILEINYTPSFTTDSPLDKHVKKNLILDTVKLLNISEEWKKQVRKKRQLQIKERMLSGKRIKYTPFERQELIRKYAQIRDKYEMQNLGNFKKIFALSQDQMLKYAHYYQFAETLYLQENKLTGVPVRNNFPFYMPFTKSPKSVHIPAKQARNMALFSSTNKFATDKKISAKQSNRGKTIQNRKITSAKITNCHQNYEKELGEDEQTQLMKVFKNNQIKKVGKIQQTKRNKQNFIQVQNQKEIKQGAKYSQGKIQKKPAKDNLLNQIQVKQIVKYGNQKYNKKKLQNSDQINFDQFQDQQIVKY